MDINEPSLMDVAHDTINSTQGPALIEVAYSPSSEGKGQGLNLDQTRLFFVLSYSYARKPEDLSFPRLDKYVEIFVGPGRGSQSIFSRIPYHAAHGDLSDKR